MHYGSARAFALAVGLLVVTFAAVHLGPHASGQTGPGWITLLAKQPYKDFQLYAEFWASDDANSGIFIRCSDPKNPGD